MMINDNDSEYDHGDDENDGGGSGGSSGNGGDTNNGKYALFCFSRHCLSIHS